MGEAVITIEATFKTRAAAESARDWLDRLTREDAENWWQGHRRETAAEFWPAFVAACPLAADILQYAENQRITPPGPVVVGETIPNDLGAVLCWRDIVDDYRPRPEQRPRVESRRLLYEARTWYWARWKPLASALVVRGAVRVEWHNPIGDFVMSSDGEYQRAASA